MCIPGHIVLVTVVLCGGVWIMLNRQDVLTMIGTGILIVIATEMVVWAITGEYAILK